MKAIDVANVFLKLSKPEYGDVLTNLKLQKLVYYTQGFYLALKNKPLFDEAIVHWEHGPVVEDLYHTLKKYSSKAVPVDADFDPSSKFTPDQLALITDINNVYGQFSAWKLRDMTHMESPWLSTESGEEISHEALKIHFKSLLVQ
jgi:uncharacterized phage-associated protein